ncbi:MAG TPA: hypothetical protein VKR79_09880 [Gaiellaceae bacterium]|nr:hypothetical protein [Gaiellaceae bacterium]
MRDDDPESGVVLSDPDPDDPTDIRNAPPPGYVVSAEDLERWRLCGKLAEAMWALNVPDEPLDKVWYWTSLRAFYSSDLPTGSPDSAEPEPGSARCRSGFRTRPSPR